MKLHSWDTVGYINAGGRGTRLNGLFNPDEKTGIAKALLSIGNPEIRLVDHHIANLRQQGIESVAVAAGDQEEVYKYINDTYWDEPSIIATKSLEQLGTGGDLLCYARQNEISTDILVQNVDTILDIDLEAFLSEFNDAKKLGRVATIALTLNSGVPNEGAYIVTAQGAVQYSREFSEEEEPAITSPTTYRASSTGAVAFTADFLRQNLWQPKDGQLPIYRHILKDAWDRGGLSAYNNGARFFRDIGTVATWLSSQNDSEFQRHLRYEKFA